MFLYIVISSGAFKSKIGQVFGGSMEIPVSVQQLSAVNGFFPLWSSFLSMVWWTLSPFYGMEVIFLKHLALQ